MKIAIASLVLFVTVNIGKAHAQAYVFFANGAPGVNAPISDASGNRIFGPSPYVADLFWSSNTNAPMDALTPAGHQTPFAPTNTYGVGYFFGGSIAFPVGVNPIIVQVRIWDTSYGSTYYEARDNGGEFGFSNPIMVIPVPPPGAPWVLVGLQSFQLQRLPRLTTTLTTTNTLVFSWPTGQTGYAVQQTLELAPANWTTLPNTPVTVGQEQQLVLPVPTTGRLFYRLISQ